VRRGAREVIECRAPASPAQANPGGRFGRGAKPPSEFIAEEILRPVGALA